MRRDTGAGRPVRVVVLCGGFGRACAAVAIAALVVTPGGCRSRGPSLSSTARGSEIVAFIPIGAVRRVTAFRWASPVEASRYIVVVRNGGTAEVLRRETSDQQLDIGPDLAGRFPPGLYAWTVEALDRNGRPLAASSVNVFEVR